MKRALGIISVVLGIGAILAMGVVRAYYTFVPSGGATPYALMWSDHLSWIGMGTGAVGVALYALSTRLK